MFQCHKSVTEGSQGTNLSVGSDSEAIEECCWLAPRLIFSYLSKAQLPKGGTTNSGLD